MCEAENDDRIERKEKSKYKPTGGSWSAQEKRMKQNQWYQGESKELRRGKLKELKKNGKKKRK